MSASHSGDLLARCEVCSVERCADCGIIHLHFGATSIRLHTRAFMLLCQALFMALAEVAPEMVEAETAGGAGSAQH